MTEIFGLQLEAWLIITAIVTGFIFYLAYECSKFCTKHKRRHKTGKTGILADVESLSVSDYSQINVDNVEFTFHPEDFYHGVRMVRTDRSGDDSSKQSGCARCCKAMKHKKRTHAKAIQTSTQTHTESTGISSETSSEPSHAKKHKKKNMTKKDYHTKANKKQPSSDSHSESTGISSGTSGEHSNSTKSSKLSAKRFGVFSSKRFSHQGLVAPQRPSQPTNRVSGSIPFKSNEMSNIIPPSTIQGSHRNTSISHKIEATNSNEPNRASIASTASFYFA